MYLLHEAKNPRMEWRSSTKRALAVRGNGEWYLLLTGNPGVGPGLGRNANCLKVRQGMTLPQSMRDPDSPIQMQTTLVAPTSPNSVIS